MNLLLLVVLDKQEGVTGLPWLGSPSYVAPGCIDDMVHIWDSLSRELGHTFNDKAMPCSRWPSPNQGYRPMLQRMATISKDGRAGDGGLVDDAVQEGSFGRR